MSDESTVLEGEEVETVEAPEGTEAEAQAIEEAETQSEETETEGELEDGESEEEESEEEDADEDEIEFNFGGNKLAVKRGAIPEELQEQIQKFADGTWSDYTRGKQEIAERQKSVEAREQAAEKFLSLQGETLETYSRGLQLREEIEQLSRQVGDEQLWQSDPDRARRASDQLSRKQAEFQTIVNTVAQKESELTEAQQAETARRMDEGRQLVERHVKGFSEKAPEVVDYVVKTYGLTKEQAETWPLNPMTAAMAYKAMMFDRMQAKAKASSKAKPAAVPEKPMKPVKGKGGKTSLDLVKDADKMSPEEWARRRNQQLAKRRG